MRIFTTRRLSHGDDMQVTVLFALQQTALSSGYSKFVFPVCVFDSSTC